MFILIRVTGCREERSLLSLPKNLLTMNSSRIKSEQIWRKETTGFKILTQHRQRSTTLWQVRWFSEELQKWPSNYKLYAMITKMFCKVGKDELYKALEVPKLTPRNWVVTSWTFSIHISFCCVRKIYNPYCLHQQYYTHVISRNCFVSTIDKLQKT